jgi:adenylate cyclase
VEKGVEGQTLTAEDQLFILMQAGLYLTVTRGTATPEVRICYERAESLCHSLNRPRLLYAALIGQWRYSLQTDELTATMQIAKHVYSLAQDHNDAGLMIGGCQALACTLCFLGDFEAAQRYAMRGVQIWRSGDLQPPVEEVSAPAVMCLCWEALSKLFLGDIASPRPALAEAISLAKELNDMYGLAVALQFAAALAAMERNLADVERYSSDLIELSTRQHFAHWIAIGAVYRGWARSASGEISDGISCIEDGIRNYRATGAMLEMPHLLTLKAEALYLADRTSEALEALSEAEALAERFEQSFWCAELHRLRGVCLAAMGADEAQIEASFCAAIRTAREQKSTSLATRAEASSAEYRCQIGRA